MYAEFGDMDVSDHCPGSVVLGITRKSKKLIFFSTTKNLPQGFLYFGMVLSLLALLCSDFQRI